MDQCIFSLVSYIHWQLILMLPMAAIQLNCSSLCSIHEYNSAWIKSNTVAQKVEILFIKVISILSAHLFRNLNLQNLSPNTQHKISLQAKFSSEQRR